MSGTTPTAKPASNTPTASPSAITPGSKLSEPTGGTVPATTDTDANGQAKARSSSVAPQKDPTCNDLRKKAEEKKAEALPKAEKMANEALGKLNDRIMNAHKSLVGVLSVADAESVSAERNAIINAYTDVKDAPLSAFGSSWSESIRIWKCEKALEKVAEADKELENSKKPNTIYDPTTGNSFTAQPTEEGISKARDNLKNAVSEYNSVGDNPVTKQDYVNYVYDTRSALTSLAVGATPGLGTLDSTVQLESDFNQGNYGGTALGILGLIPVVGGLGKGAFKLGGRLFRTGARAERLTAKEAAELAKRAEKTLAKEAQAIEHPAEELAKRIPCRRPCGGH